MAHFFTHRTNAAEILMIKSRMMYPETRRLTTTRHPFISRIEMSLELVTLNAAPADTDDKTG